MRRFNLFLPDQQYQHFYRLAKRTGLSVGEIMRRMHDHCLTPLVINEMIPTQSGRLIETPIEVR